MVWVDKIVEVRHIGKGTTVFLIVSDFQWGIF